MFRYVIIGGVASYMEAASASNVNPFIQQALARGLTAAGPRARMLHLLLERGLFEGNGALADRPSRTARHFFIA